MEPKYRYSESTEKPSALEITSSNTVYLRKDIQSETRTDDQGTDVVYWTYQEAALTAEEFNRYTENLMALNAIKDVDNAANIKQLVSGQEISDFNILAMMEAMAEIYEMIAMLG